MNCPECHERLQERLDGGARGEDTALAHHLAKCRTCRELAAAADHLAEGLRHLPTPVAPVDLNARIVTKILVQRRRLRLGRALTVAAAHLLAASIGYFVIHAVRAPHVAIVEPPPMQPAPSLQVQVREAGSAMVALTRRTAAETLGQSPLLWQDLFPFPLPSTDPPILQEALDPPARSLRQAGQSVTAALEPVTSSAQRAVSLFLRDTTPDGLGSKPGL